MNEGIELTREVQDENPVKPAVGILATGENDDAVARAVVRSSAADHPVIITYTGDRPAILDALSEFDITVVPPTSTDSSSTIEPTDRLTAAAQPITDAGLIYIGEADFPIDYRRSEAKCIDDAVVVPGVPEDLPQSGILAAIPAYNEAETIAEVVHEAQAHADEVIVIDDGSADATAARAEKAGATVINHGHNRGYGAALRTAFETAAAGDVDCLVIFDGDGQHDPTDIPRIVDRLHDSDANVVIGSRFVDGADSTIPLYRRFGLQVVNLMTNVSIGSFHPGNWIRDTQSGFRAYDRRSVEHLADSDAIGDDMDASLDIIYQLLDAGCTIDEVGTTIDYDVENGSSQHPLRHGLTLIHTILLTVERDHPILLLGVPGFLLTLGGLSAGYLTIANYLSTETFPLGLGLVSAFLIMLGVFAAFTAIVLHSLQAHLKGK